MGKNNEYFGNIEINTVKFPHFVNKSSKNCGFHKKIHGVFAQMKRNTYICSALMTVCAGTGRCQRPKALHNDKMH